MMSTWHPMSKKAIEIFSHQHRIYRFNVFIFIETRMVSANIDKYFEIVKFCKYSMCFEFAYRKFYQVILLISAWHIVCGKVFVCPQMLISINKLVKCINIRVMLCTNHYATYTIMHITIFCVLNFQMNWMITSPMVYKTI